MKIELGKRYRLGKHEGRVIAVDRNHPYYPVVFMQDDGVVSMFTVKGQKFVSTVRGLQIDPHQDHLQEIPKTYWVNVYKNDAFVHPTRLVADNEADIESRLACIKVEEGEFHED